MKKINFEDLPSTNTPLSAENLNSIQSNIEDVFNGNEPMGSIVVDDISCKNKFQILTQSLSAYGVTLTHNVDGSISIKGTSTSSSVYLTALKKIDVKDIDECDYTISFKNDFIANAIAIRLRKVTGTTKTQIDELIYLDKKNKSKVLNLKSLIDSNTESIEMDIVLFSAMEYNYTIYPQIEKGSTSSSYTQYKKYGYNSNESMGNIIVNDISCKNKLGINNYENIAWSKNNNSTIVFEEETIKITTNGTLYSGIFGKLLKFANINPNETYTISFEASSDNSISFQYGTTASPINGSLNTQNKKISFTDLGNNIIDKNFVFYSLTSVISTITIKNIQIEKGLVATDYVQHKEYDNNLVQANINELASKLNVITKNTGSNQSVTFNGSLTGRYIFMYMTILNGGTGVAGIFTINNGEVVSNSKILDNSTTGTVSITASTTGFTLTFSRNYSSCTVISPNIALN